MSCLLYNCTVVSRTKKNFKKSCLLGQTIIGVRHSPQLKLASESVWKIT